MFYQAKSKKAFQDKRVEDLDEMEYIYLSKHEYVNYENATYYLKLKKIEEVLRYDKDLKDLGVRVTLVPEIGKGAKLSQFKSHRFGNN